MATGLSKTIVLLPLLFLGIYLIRVAEIQLEAKMQHHIRPHERATMTSMKSLVFELVYVAIILLLRIYGKDVWHSFPGNGEWNSFYCFSGDLLLIFKEILLKLA